MARQTREDGFPQMSAAYIHPTAQVSDQATIGDDTRIWSQAQVREGATLGSECNIGKNVYVDFDVKIGNRVKIQNNSSVYHGVTVDDGVFIGPHVCFCNDMTPRAITPDGKLKGNDDWEVGPSHVKRGASVGAGSIILPNVTIGEFAMIGAGSVVTRDVPDHGLVYGNPARQHGFVCGCGRALAGLETPPADGVFPLCPVCQAEAAQKVEEPAR